MSVPHMTVGDGKWVFSGDGRRLKKLGIYRRRFICQMKWIDSKASSLMYAEYRVYDELIIK